jgi:transcription elongation factor GreA
MDNLMNKAPMTLNGVEQLRQELEHLKREERPLIVKAIEEARAHGDLRENAEYHSAKERQGFIEGRIQYIESKLANALIVDITKVANKNTVVFGCTVHLASADNDQTVVYQIVGDDEADVKVGKISINSPIARALIGKTIGNEVEVVTPSGKKYYEITALEYI